MFIELLFATTLDMSLPEFQPMEDISGNVIVSELDDVSGDIIAEEIPLEKIPFEETSERSLQGLSLETVPAEEVFTNGLVLRSSVQTIIDSSSVSGRSIIYQNSHWVIKSKSGKTLYYVLLHSGIEYTVISGSVKYISSSIAVDTIVSSFSDTQITPNEDVYLISTDGEFSVSYIDNSGGDVSGDDVSGDDVSGDSPGGDVSGGDIPSIEVDLTIVENKIDKLIILGRSLLFVLIVQFCYPLIISIFNNIGGGRDV